MSSSRLNVKPVRKSSRGSAIAGAGSGRGVEYGMDAMAGKCPPVNVDLETSSLDEMSVVPDESVPTLVTHNSAAPDVNVHVDIDGVSVDANDSVDDGASYSDDFEDD